MAVPPRIAAFHKHLDVCKRCAERPFDLCTIGAVLLKRAAKPAQDHVNALTDWFNRDN